MKFTNNLLHLSLREAFLDILPYYVLSSLGILLLDVFNLDGKSNIFVESLLNISNTFKYLFPLFLIIAIAYHLSKNYHIHRFIIISLSLLIFVTLAGDFDNNEFKFRPNTALYAFLIPIISLYSYIFLTKIKFFKIVKGDVVSSQLKIIINSLIPMLIIYISFTILIPYLSEFIHFLLEDFFSKTTKSISIDIKAFMQVFISQIIWWLTGIHGTHIYNIFADTSFFNLEIFENLDTVVFIYNFILYGGAGATLSLIIAILIKSKNMQSRKIAYLSLPFAVFNINEILLFGLPIIMNLSFMIPFLLLPLFNFISSYLFFSYFIIPESTHIISWTTPIFVSGYFLGNGETYAFIFLQLFNLIFGVFLYMPFMKHYDKTQSLDQDTKKLREKFGIKEQIDSMQEINFLKTQAEIIKEQSYTHKMVNELIKGDLLLYYQPKINIKNESCYGFEALLRFKNENNKVVGPYFIPQIEKAGYSYVIDLWVLKQVFEDLEKWNSKGFFPKISINLSVETISNEYIINKIIKKLKNKNVEIEILERTFANDHNKFLDNIVSLKKNGFTISVDDFGTGFSSLQYLHMLPANIIKLDKVLLDNTKEDAGKTLYKDIARMCRDLDYLVISEGVETKEDLDFTKSVGIDVVQGFYYSKAIPFNKVKSYYDKSKTK